MYCTVVNKNSFLGQVGHEGVACRRPHEAGHQGEHDEDGSEVGQAGTLGTGLIHWFQLRQVIVSNIKKMTTVP